uniref:Alpha-conotoxin-like Reg1f n=1 Tax=Conus regius TaxID=101314 RepID=CA1F_CONRE|nr:RecName: Full=Alpha-conotoxin-like Reg1f [Conus regius]
DYCCRRPPCTLIC